MNDEVVGAAGAFDVEAWREELLALNPWAAGLTLDDKDETFATARQNATLERHAQGKHAWNAWAHGMLGLKTALETAGRWSEQGQDRNEETTFWIGLSAAVFSTREVKHTFDDQVTFEEVMFPLYARFEGATFSGDARFNGATFTSDVQFVGATFSGTAWFKEATFSGNALFQEATFSGSAQFDGATFSSAAWFQGSTFSGDAHFERTSFSGNARNDGALFGLATFSARAFFRGATFSRHARFDRATFSHQAVFEKATFSGNTRFEGATFSFDALFNRATFSNEAVFAGTTFLANSNFTEVQFIGVAIFSQAKFLGAAVFDDSEFRSDANFEALDSQGTFSLASAKFRQVPNFGGASFRGLRLDNVQTPRYRRIGWTSDSNAPARFRELKRRANEAQDRDREIEFFAQEIRTSRFHSKHFPAWVPRVWEWRFWFGLLFGTFSDFGRSLWRPAAFWLILGAVSFMFYLGEHDDMRKARAALNPDGLWSTAWAYVQTTYSAYANPPTCRPQGKEMFASTDGWTEARMLSLANAVVVDTGRGNSSRRTYGCLYGFEAVGDQEYARVSARVSLVSTFQSLASGVLILLFLLAVRNLLRLK